MHTVYTAHPNGRERGGMTEVQFRDELTHANVLSGEHRHGQSDFQRGFVTPEVELKVE